MSVFKKRRLLAKASALLAVTVLAFSASPAQATTPALPAPPEKTAVTITKLEQPDEKGEHASGGLIQEGSYTPIEGVAFEVYEVHLEETAGTNAWQLEIAGMDLGTAQGRIGEEPQHVRDGVTDSDGKVTWEGDKGALGQGLYLIRETGTPGNVAPAGDFLLALPMTDPGTGGWLKHVHIYPKGAKAEGENSVINASEYVVGDTVTWTITADIPQIRDHGSGKFQTPEYFKISDEYTSGLKRDGAVTVKIGETELLTGQGDNSDDYNLTVSDNRVEILFTDNGLALLQQALDEDITEVTVTVETTVNETGELENNPFVYFAEQGLGQALGPSVAKYGNYKLTVTGTDGEFVEGAQFRAYLQGQEGEGESLRPYSADNPGGYLEPAGTDGLWTTNADGVVELGGFRDSFFANGEEVTEDHEDYQGYYFVQVHAPEGGQLIVEPIDFEVGGKDGGELEVKIPSNTNAFLLPLTGGSGTTMLTIAGFGILALVLVVARKRRNADA